MTAGDGQYGVAGRIHPIAKRDGFGAFNPQLLAATWSWVAKSMNYPMDKVNPESLVNRSFLTKPGR